MKLRKIFLLLILTLLFIGLSYATEVSNDRISADDSTIETSTTKEVAVQSSNTHIKEEDNTLTDKTSTKEITKQYNSTKKMASKTYTVNNFNTLHNALTSNTYDTLTLNIKSDIILEDYTELNSAIKTLTINGNGKTINGDNLYRFLYIDSSSKVTIKNIKIINCYSNYGRGAIYNYGTLTITNSTLNNNAAEYGGAIYNDYDSTIIINNSTLNNNTATWNGGAIYNHYGTLTITNSTLNNNTAEYSGGAIYNDHGTLTITNSTLNNNTAKYDGGGAIYNDHGTLTINNSTLNNNTAKYDGGGAIYNHYGTLTINNSTLNNNTAAEYRGGAIYNYYGTLTITNSTLNNNTARQNGGAIYNDGTLTIHNSTLTKNKATQYGGAIYTEANITTIKNNNFEQNTAKEGAAIYNLPITYTTSYKVNETYYSSDYQYYTGILIQTPGWHTEEVTKYKDVTEGTLYVTNNTFYKNKANTTGKVIINETKATITNNTNSETSTYSSTIYTNATTITIKNNIFTDGSINITVKNQTTTKKTNTKTTISTVKGIIGEKLTLKATVTDTNNKKVNEGNLIFKLNGITIKDNGKLTGSSNPLKVKVTNGVATATVVPDLDMRNANKLTAKYVGTDNYNASDSSQVKIQVSQRNASIVVSSNVKTIKQGQVLTITAKIYDTTNGKRSTNLTKFNEEFVYFKVNGITLKDSKGAMQKVKVVNGTATIKYTIPLGLSGVTDGKTFTVKNHTILAGFYNKNYKENIRNTSTFQVERSNITITISNATVNNKTHKLSLTATIKDYLGNKVIGPNKCIIKVNGVTLKNGTQPIYYFASYGVLNIKDINIPSYNKYTSIEIVTQDRLAYKNQRNTTTTIKVTK